MQKNKIFERGMVLCLALVIGLTFAGTAFSKTTTLKMQLWQGPSHTWTKAIRDMAPYVGKMSDGRLEVKVYDSSTLASNSEFLEACSRGMIDIGDWYPMSNSKSIPFVNIMGGLPLVYKDSTHANTAWWDTGMIELLDEAIKKQGYKNIGVGPTWNAGFFHLGFKEKVQKPEDLKGLKVLVRGSTTQKYLEDFGARTVSGISSAEVYDALERGVIDGNWGVHSNWVDWKWMEPNDYLLNIPLNGIQMAWVWNKKKIEGLPDDLRAIFEEWLWMVTYRLAVINYEMQDNYFNLMREHMEFVTPTEEQMKLWKAPKDELVKQYVEENGELGEKAIKIIEETRK